jgi:hypothetical protein
MTKLIVLGMEVSRRSYEWAMTPSLHRSLLEVIRKTQGQGEDGESGIRNAARWKD